jgi:hypothetical protein
VNNSEDLDFLLIQCGGKVGDCGDAAWRGTARGEFTLA